MKPRAVLYARVSTAMQERDGVSLDAQLAMARQFCESRGLDLVAHYVDTMSGTKDDRPGLAKLEADLAARAFDFVIVYKLDRLSRSAAHYHALLQRLEAAGANLASLTQPFDGTTSIGRFMLAILIAAAELEVDTTADRIHDSIRYRAQQGRIIMGKTPPLGYDYHPAHTDADGRRVPGRLSVNEAEAAVVRWIFERFLVTRSLATVTQDAAELGIRPRGKPLYKSTASRIIRRRLYKGELETMTTRTSRRGGKRTVTPTDPSERIITAGFPAIVDVETWDAANAIAEGNAALPPRAINSRGRFPWSGLLRCGTCGASLARFGAVPTRPERRSYYRCPRRSQLGPSACAKPGLVPEVFLDETVAPGLFAAVSKALMKKIPRAPAPKPRSESSAVAAGLAEIEARRERIQDMYEHRELAPDKYRARLAKLDAEADALKALASQGADAVLPVPPALTQDLAQAWVRLADQPAARRDLLAALIATVEVSGPGKRTVKVFVREYAHPGWPDVLRFSVPDLRGRGERRKRPKGGA